MLEALKMKMFSILEADSVASPIRNVFRISLICLILLNVIAVTLETVYAIYSRYTQLFNYFEIFSIVIFTLEYIMRLWSCTSNPEYSKPIIGRIKYAFRPLALVDLMAFLPFYFPTPLDLRFIRIFRLIRLLKLGRYTKAFSAFNNVFRKKKEELMVAVFVVFLLLIFSSTIMYYVENQAQPKTFSSIPASMWWGVATLTTIGYGDIYPITPLGKVFGAIMAILGIGIFALPAGILGSGFVEEFHHREKESTICSHCGKGRENLPS